MSEKGFWRKREKKTAPVREDAIAVRRPEEERIRPLNEGELCCPWCGRLLLVEDVVCSACGKEQPWCLKEV